MIEIEKIWMTDEAVWIRTKDGREACELFEDYPRLKVASAKQRAAHPELNASAIARRLGISQSLFAQYISGTKKPSKERRDKIYAVLHEIGQELISIPA